VSITEGYVKNKCIGFIIENFHKFDAVQRHVKDTNEEYGDAKEDLEGVGRVHEMSPILRNIAHRYVLANANIMEHWLS
jgi:hypothetical protein